MKSVSIAVVLFMAASGYSGIAAADPWKDESGHGRWVERRGGDDWRRHYPRRSQERYSYKQEYEVGGCKIERKWEKGEYKEEIKCRDGWRPAGRAYRY